MSKAKSAKPTQRQETVADLVDMDDSSIEEPDDEIPADDDIVELPDADAEPEPEEVVEGVEAPRKSDAREYIRTIIVVKPELMRTSSVMNMFEMTEHVSIRSTQIAQWNNCMVDTTGLTDPVDMARRELMMRKSPLILRRHVGDRVVGNEIESYYEYWSPNDMAFATSYDV